MRRSLVTNAALWQVEEQDYVGHLETLSDEQEARLGVRPGYALDEDSAHVPTDICINLLFQKVRDINEKASTVGFRGVLSLQWNTGLVGYHINCQKLWTPTIKFLNNDDLNLTHEVPHYFPETGDVKMLVIFDGSASNEFDLKFFPWDFDQVSLMFVAEMDAPDSRVRLFWQDRKIEEATPGFLNKQLAEWDLLPALNTLKRLRFLKDDQTWGHYSGLKFTFYMRRNVGYYLIKILSIVLMINVISWGALHIRPDPIWVEVADDPSRNSSDHRQAAVVIESGGRVMRKVKPLTYLSHEQFTERLNLLAALLLACVAFQYLIDDAIPKMGSMTTIDWLLMSSYLTMFVLALETFVVYRYSLAGAFATAESIDDIFAIIVPAFYLFLQTAHILRAVIISQRALSTAKGDVGVQPSLKMSNEDAVADVLNQVARDRSNTLDEDPDSSIIREIFRMSKMRRRTRTSRSKKNVHASGRSAAGAGNKSSKILPAELTKSH